MITGRRLRDQLRRARSERNLTQGALAALAGTSRVTIARLESATAAHDVRLGTLGRACEALGLELAALPAGADAELGGRRLAREQEQARRLSRRLAHALLAARLLAASPGEGRRLLSGARSMVARWERERLCSPHYIVRWRAMLAGPAPRVARAILAAGEWRDALFQNSPWGFALEPPAP